MNKYQLLIVSASSEAEEMKLQLSENGFTQVSIVDYHHVLAAVQAAIPDLILLTKQQGLSSLSLINRISRQFPMVPIVMVATDVAGEAMREHVEAGVSDYIYYAGAEKELLGFVVMQNLESRSNAALVEASEEARARFQQLERDQMSGFRMQQSMMPQSPRYIRRINFNHQLYPSMIMSGDFIDYFELFDGRVAFYIADVSGHGASSAFITVLLKSLSRRLLDNFQRFMSTAEILSWINAELLQWHLEQHVTMFLGVVNQEQSMLEYSNAANFPGTIFCHAGGTEFLETGGQPLGLHEEPVYETHKLALPETFSIVMFSDGVFDVLPQKTLKNREDHLLSVVECRRQGKQPDSLVDELVDELGISGADSIPDDIAIFTLVSAGNREIYEEGSRK